MSQNKGIVDEIVDLTNRSAKLSVRLFSPMVTTSFRLLNATLEGINEALKPKKEIKVKPSKKEKEATKKKSQRTKIPRK